MIRFFDICISAFGLIILSPVLIIIGLLIVLGDNNGSILYKQQRVGKDFVPFSLLKFRTMYAGSDSKGLLTVGMRDLRITKVGYFLRKYKLDELPQLINVLFGNMSIVGPRPEVEKYTSLYTEKQKKVLSVKPGITDYASIFFVNENLLLSQSENPEETYVKEIMVKKINLNMLYINSPNIYIYFKIIFLTIFSIIHNSTKRG